MSRKLHLFLLSAMMAIFALSPGCSSETSKTNGIAYISSNTGSKYQSTFSELLLGTVLDYKLKLPRADRSWVRIWVEGYSNGKAADPFPLIELSYGLNPEKETEGNIGFCIIRTDVSEPQFLLYSTDGKTGVHASKEGLILKTASSTCHYAIENKTRELKSGEEVIIGVYRQANDSLKAGYDYEDPDSISKMISENTTVLLLKIKVEEK